HVSLIAVHHDFRHSGPRVVVGAHDKTIGTCGTYCQQVAGQQVQGPLLAEEVTGFAHRPHQVIGCLNAIGTGPDRNNVHPGVVQGGADQIVHGGINDGEVLMPVVLQAFNAGQQNAGVG